MPGHRLWLQEINFFTTMALLHGIILLVLIHRVLLCITPCFYISGNFLQSRTDFDMTNGHEKANKQSDLTITGGVVEGISEGVAFVTVNAVGDMVGNSAEAVSDAVGAAAEVAGESVGNIAEVAGNVIGAVAEGVAENIGNIIGGIVEGIFDGLR